MSMKVAIYGRVRKLLEAIDASSASDEEQLALTPQLEQLVAAGASPYREITRAGRAFYSGTTAAAAAVVAIPTTGVMFQLFNSSPDAGKVMVIDWVAALNVVSTAVASQATLLLNLGQQKEAAVPTVGTMAIRKANGMSSSTGFNDTIAVPSTAALSAGTGVAAAWFPYGKTGVKTGAAATPGYGIFEPVDGRLIVPPYHTLGINVLANVIGETFQVWCGWHEVQTDLG